MAPVAADPHIVNQHLCNLDRSRFPAQFGADTFAGAKTYLGPRMIISPATMLPEARHLRELGVADPFSRLSVHPDCLVSTSYHVWMNQLRELSRGKRRHGSCGLGIGEARHYWLHYGMDAVFASDLKDQRKLQSKLTLMRERFLLEVQDLPHIDKDLCVMLHDTTPGIESDLLQHCSRDLILASLLPECRVAIFEGAQGVLLDEWKGFHPYTTWSTVTPLHALELIETADITDLTILGVTRAYSTRHGAGPFPTECRKMSEQLVDHGNPKNDWQGSIRSGPLDLVLLKYAASVCQIDALVVNCLDQLPQNPRICSSYADTDRIEIPTSLNEQTALTKRLESVVPLLNDTTVDGLLEHLSEIAPIEIMSFGPTADRRRATSWNSTLTV